MPLLTPELFTEVHDKQRAMAHTERTGDTCDFAMYRCLKNRLKMHIKSAQSGYLRGILGRMEDNPCSVSDLYQAVYQIIGRSSTIKLKLFH